MGVVTDKHLNTLWRELMGFKKMTRPKFPPRLWSLVGYPGSGKSSFAARMHGPMVVVDADHRFTEVMGLAGDEVYQLSDVKSDNVDPDAITRHLTKNMPGSDVQTIVVDSLTAIITPLVVQAMLDNDTGRQKNLAAGFRTKALAMRQLQDAITRWGCDVLWIYHLQDARDGRAQAVTRATISATELARLTRSINLQLEIVQDGDRRGIKVIWARRGRSGMVIWDDTGSWDGMPERIEDAVYDGLSADEQDAIEKANPDYFPNPQTAVAWAIERGAFTSPEEARRSYDQVKDETQPRSAREMAAYWVESVEARMTAAVAAAAVEEERAAAPAEPAEAAPEVNGKRRSRKAPEPEPEPEMDDAIF